MRTPAPVLYAALAAVLLAATSAAFAKEDPPTIEAVVAEVDRAVAATWEEQGLVPAPEAGDAEILRRLTLDLAGRLPTAAEARAYLDDPAPDKRSKLVERLVASEAAALHFGEWYARSLLGRDRVQVEHQRALEDWLAAQYRTGAPFDQVVTALLAATGPVEENGAGAYMAQFAGDVPALAGRTARLFLGVRVQCAQCHDHPWDEWTQADFHGFAAYFSRTIRQKIPTPIDEANALNGRGRRHVQIADAAVKRLEKEVPALEKQLADAAKALAAAEKAWKPQAAAIAKAEKPVNAAGERVPKIEAIATKAKALLTRTEASLKAAPKPLVGELTEQQKTAKQLADLSSANVATAKNAVAAWTTRLEAARAKAKPLADQRNAAKAKHEQLKKQIAERKTLLAGAKAGLEQAKALAEAARELAGAAPSIYNDSYAAEGKRVPPPAFRVVDRGGDVKPKKDPKHPELGDGMPRPLQGEALAGKVDGAKLRDALATWVTSPTNPFLARAVVNRAADRLLGQGFVDPVDDLTGQGERFAEPALALLAADFRASGYDYRRLLAVLANTRAYRLTTAAAAEADSATIAYARVKELTPPVALRAMVAAVLPGSPEAAAGGPRAQREALVRRHGSLFDDGSDRPAREPQGGIRRALWMMNGAPASDLLRGRKEGLAHQLAHKDVANDDAVEEVFLALLTRRPTTDEKAIATKALPPPPAAKPDGKTDAKQVAAWRKTRTEVLEDLIWALVNGPEFLTNH